MRRGYYMEMPNNPFVQLAHALWAAGDDGEGLARSLAEAFVSVTDQASNDEGEKPDPVSELIRFINE